MLSTIVVPAGAHHTSLISEMKTALGSGTRFTSTGRRAGVARVPTGVTPGDPGTVVAGTRVGASVGSGVTSTVATVGRSGGGSSHSSTCATTRLKA